MPVGYDGHVDGIPTSAFMMRYGTGGTPWTIVIDKKGMITFVDINRWTSPKTVLEEVQKAAK